jgi:ricin-type beta-trefoil lectin protein
VIDIQENSTTPGTHLDAYTQKLSGPDWNNQLWTFVDSGVEGAYLLQNPASQLVIDVQGNSTQPGTPLDAFTEKVLPGPGPLPVRSPNQLWSVFPSSVAGYYFIWSKLGDLVIDVHRNGTTPGTPLDVYPKKTTGPDWDNQLWTFVNERGESVTPPSGIPFTDPALS